MAYVGRTPRTNGSKFNPSSRHQNITLSDREYAKITDTLASARRTRQQRQPYDDVDDIDGFNEPSFIAETSFVRAPLNSRVSTGGYGGGGGERHGVSNKGKGKETDFGRGDALDLRDVPLDVQEALILEDLLYVLTGIEGSYITQQPDSASNPLHGIHYTISPSLGLDSSLSDLVQRILPLGTYFTAISAFIEQRSDLDYGLVNHALCAKMRDLMRDYGALVSQLEWAFNYADDFSLKKMWFYVHPTVHTMGLVWGLVVDIGEGELGQGEGDDDDEAGTASEESDVDPEEEARNEALGIVSGKKLKSILASTSAGPATTHAHIPIKGGELLSILSSLVLTMSGDPTAHTLYSSLLQAAGAPYASMLRTWMMSGRLLDVYEEVMVKEARFIDRGILQQDYTDEYWERRYTLRDGSVVGGVGGLVGGGAAEMKRQAGIPPPRQVGGRLPGGACVPPLLEAYKQKILLAGKYLNVIRECGIERRMENKEAEEPQDYNMEDVKFYKLIDTAYTHANQTLLTLLLKDQMLVARLRSLRRYFFLSHSSFLTHFLDLGHSELRKSSKGASIVKLQSLLEVSLNSETGSEAEFKEDVKVTMSREGLYEWLLKVVGESGHIIPDDGADVPVSRKDNAKEKDADKKPLIAIDALTFDYNVKFPLSLVISRKTILRYQLLFRFLLHLKHVEQSLSSMWIEHMMPMWRTSSFRSLRPTSTSPTFSSPRSPTPSQPAQMEFDQWRTRVFLLRARMMSFVQHILAFATFEVLEPNWRALEAKLAKVGTVDQLLRDHVDFLDTCLRGCMLTSGKLIKAFSRLIVTCSTFAMYTAMFTKSATQAAADGADTNQAKRWDVFLKFETNFDHWFKIYLDCVQFYASSDNVSLLPLVVRLNSINVKP